MKAMAMAMVILVTASTWAQASPQHNAVEICGEPGKAHANVTISPEVRVSVVRTSEPLPVAGPDGVVELQIEISNHGFLMSPLEARLIGLVPDGAKIEFSARPLTGARKETRMLRLYLSSPGLADVTISFKAQNDVTDLGGRDRVYFLVKRE